MSSYKQMTSPLSRKMASSMGGFSIEDDDSEEMSPEEKLQERVFRPYYDLNHGLHEVSSLVTFVRENVSDAEFAETVCKKIVKDLRSLVDRFEADTKG